MQQRYISSISLSDRQTGRRDGDVGSQREITVRGLESRLIWVEFCEWNVCLVGVLLNWCRSDESLHYNSHFPGGYGRAGARMLPFWILVEQG